MLKQISRSYSFIFRNLSASPRHMGMSHFAQLHDKCDIEIVLKINLTVLICLLITHSAMN